MFTRLCRDVASTGNNRVKPLSSTALPRGIPGRVFTKNKLSQMNNKDELEIDESQITRYQPDNKGEIVLYQPDGFLKLEVRLENETVWLNRQQISLLFDRDIKTIGKHINNALNEELQEFSTVAKFATVQLEGNREVIRNIEYYNLDMILSIGYRVKSVRGIQFRAWSNRVLMVCLFQNGTECKYIAAKYYLNNKKITKSIRC
jgi:hypothetical protein